MSPADQIETLRRRCERIVSEDELIKKLGYAAKSGKQLRVKLGMDPTAPDVTLGHCVPLKVIRQFQDWGHKAVLIIGDATAAVGDPTGVNTTRPLLSPEQIAANAETYIAQVGKVLRTDDDALEVRRNSEWLGQMDLTQLIKLAARKTVAQVLERDDFKQRYESNTPIGLHEFIYPLLQGWDSVAIDADIEFGGNDQLFNNLVGRDFQQQEGKAPQVVIVTPLLVGTDGALKMSKSKGNYIAVTDPPGGDGGMFGKVMSLPDELMAQYFTLLTESEQHDGESPRDAKVRLAKLIVTEFHDAAAADDAEKQFMTATHGGIPDDIPTASATGNILDVLVKVGFCRSKGEARRKINEGGVRVDGEKVADIDATVSGGVLQLGKKKFVRLG
ncbi:MAG: tyrosine--tRNA ligase [Planctomycetota bacterium]